LYNTFSTDCMGGAAILNRLCILNVCLTFVIVDVVNLKLQFWIGVGGVMLEASKLWKIHLSLN
jgi:hypothetical protein